MNLPTIRLGIRDEHRRKGFAVSAPDEERIVHDLKDEVPSFQRRYSEAYGGWWVAEPYLPALTAILLAYYPAVRMIESDGSGSLVYADGMTLNLMSA